MEQSEKVRVVADVGVVITVSVVNVVVAVAVGVVVDAPVVLPVVLLVSEVGGVREGVVVVVGRERNGGV